MIAPLTKARERFDAVLLDLDGSLLDPFMKITPRSEQAVRSLVDAGFRVLLCTGRSVTGSVRFHEQLGLDTVLAAYNGSWIGQPGEAPWRHVRIPDELVDDLRRMEEKAHFSFRHDIERKASVVRDHPLYERVAGWYGEVELHPSQDGMPRTGLMRVTCYFDDDEACQVAWRELPVRARERLHPETFPLALFRDFAETDPWLLEVHPKSRGKAEVYAWLEQVEGIPASRVIAVGDHKNDVSMLERAGLAVAMGNADPAAVAVADTVIGRHDEDGIAAWIEGGLPVPGRTNGR